MSDDWFPDLWMAAAGHYEVYGKKILHSDIGRHGNLLLLVNEHGLIVDQHPLTGTLPFMSAELLTGKFYFHRGVKVIPLHDFIHDLESFCWVLVWICLTRDGPARRRRALYLTEQATDTAELREQVLSLFESGRREVALAKQNIMLMGFRGDFPIVDHVSEFYSPLRRLITDFLKILVEAYQQRPANLALEDTTAKWKEESVMDAEAVYNLVIDASESHVSSLKDAALSEAHDAMQRQEDARGKADSGATCLTVGGLQRTTRRSILSTTVAHLP
ncbi:hypothetical protein C8Q72DRAFT_879063 [Fomitopsis betulina]|nr:hypothetical protein C8Q72DRAFT_879063 [Fomitopsis betulina]